MEGEFVAYKDWLTLSYPCWGSGPAAAAAPAPNQSSSTRPCTGDGFDPNTGCDLSLSLSLPTPSSDGGGEEGGSLMANYYESHNDNESSPSSDGGGEGGGSLMANYYESHNDNDSSPVAGTEREWHGTVFGLSNLSLSLSLPTPSSAGGGEEGGSLMANYYESHNDNESSPVAGTEREWHGTVFGLSNLSLSLSLPTPSSDGGGEEGGSLMANYYESHNDNESSPVAGTERERHGAVFGLSKRATKSDASPNQHRLQLTRSDIAKASQPLKDLAEAAQVNAVPVKVVDREGNEYDMVFKYLDSSNTYRFMGRGYTSFLSNSSLTENQIVDIWAMLGEDQDARRFAFIT